MLSFVVIGPGVVGTALASLLKDRGYKLIGVVGRNQEKTSQVAQNLGCSFTDQAENLTLLADIIFITTSDQAINSVVTDVAQKGGFRPGHTVIHTSGALPSTILQPAKEQGAQVLSLHPLQSFASPEMAVSNLPGSFFTIEGDNGAYGLAEDMVRALEGNSFYIKEEDKPLYHAAACVASNFIVTLVDYAINLLALTGIPKEQGIKALQPLINGTVNNIKNLGTAKALTGPISRGDGETVNKHLQELQKKNPEDRELYRQLGLYTINVALHKGSINQEKARELKGILKEE